VLEGCVAKIRVGVAAGGLGLGATGPRISYLDMLGWLACAVPRAGRRFHSRGTSTRLAKDRNSRASMHQCIDASMVL
jgi:hypothetical protein